MHAICVKALSEYALYYYDIQFEQWRIGGGGGGHWAIAPMGKNVFFRHMKRYRKT